MLLLLFLAGGGVIGPVEPPVVVEEPTTGGATGWRNLYRAERARKRRRELEDEADRLELALAAEGLLEPAPVVLARHAVREYALHSDELSRRAQRAIAYAERAQTELAYQLALRAIEQQLMEEEFALLMALAAAT